MAGQYVLRVAFDLTDGAPLAERERWRLESAIQHYLKERETPMPDDAVIHCVEIMTRCPCCDRSERACACLIELRGAEPFCLDHHRIVSVTP